MKRFAPAYRRTLQVLKSDLFGPVTMASFTFVIGPGFGGDLRRYLIDNPVHMLDLARFLLGGITDLRAEFRESDECGHALVATAHSLSDAVCSFNFSTTGSWRHRNEVVEIYGRGTAIAVDNVATSIYRPSEPPAQVWHPNFTVPEPQNSTAVLMGFVPELVHFREVAMEGKVNQSDMTSAAVTLELAEQLCAFAGVL